MLRKLVALTALSVAVAVAPVTTASAEPYTPKIPTETQIVVVDAQVGKPVELEVSASANYPTPPEGDIKVQVLAASSTARGARAVAAAPLFTTTVHFVDEAVAVTGPALPQGRYIATAAFTPDDAGLFLPSDASTAFRLGAGAPDDGDDGGLPGTGGPNLMWLLLGTALVGAGAAGVGYGRRRQQGATA
ncbi:hypothetical protein L615_002000000590 [Nocardioides sp. J9]|uniref:hypothetical protein n=1 Tax=unclassified Nocardioides TaxID=2615069 RepID=UPI00048AC62B|nr:MULTISPECIES: hypothetical protein [unclassified Nocardioides]TWG90940.1 hypothetical protein L615_008600000070 [Nocardioides sp. J9]TWH00736.1 hypothetical protein L615_002000000590 [Nocardioides sp. J9]